LWGKRRGAHLDDVVESQVQLAARHQLVDQRGVALLDQAVTHTATRHVKQEPKVVVVVLSGWCRQE
jgi:hypothetical protein